MTWTVDLFPSRSPLYRELTRLARERKQWHFCPKRGTSIAYVDRASPPCNMKNDHVDSGDDIGPRESDHVLVPYNGGHDRQENDITDAAIDLILLKVATCTASASGNKRNGDSMADKKEHKAAASASTKKLEKNLAELKREFRQVDHIHVLTLRKYNIFSGP